MRNLKDNKYLQDAVLWQTQVLTWISITRRDIFLMAPGSNSSIILLQILSSLSWQFRKRFTKHAQRSGSFLPSKESNSAATYD